MKATFGTFRKNHFLYRPIIENDNAVLYCQIDTRKNIGKILGYEVHQKKTRKAKKIGETVLKPCARRPSDEEFGKWAWSFTITQFEKATQKMDDLSHD
jgi:hypothetical protein